MRPLKVLLLFALLPFGVAQTGGPPDASAEPPPNQIEVIPGVTVVLDDRYSEAEFEVAQEVFASPSALLAALRPDETTATLTLSLAARVNAELRLETSHPDLLLSGSEAHVRLLAGDRQSFSFTAFSPHEGEIRVYNSEDTLLARVPYRVTREHGVQQRLGTTVTTDGAISANYSLGYQNFSGSVGVSYSGETVSGSLSGSYSW